VREHAPLASQRAAPTRRWKRFLATIAVAATVVGSCGRNNEADSPASEEPTVLVTTSIWADVVANVACDGLVTIETIVPPGADPHAFEPSLSGRQRMDDAALIIANGLGLEEGLDDTIDAAANAGTPVLRVGEHVDTIAFSLDRGDDAGARDPHVWFDPERVSGVLPQIAQRLVDEVDIEPNAVDACLKAYQAELAAVDAEIAALVGQIPEQDRNLVTSHDALGYFADRYGFDVIGTVIPSASTLAEPNPRQLEELAQLIERSDVSAIFAEREHATDDAGALASRVGNVAVVTLRTGSLSGPDGEAGTYIRFLLSNAELIVGALG
jgi:zinc/manganese transport system substrate-binding protein